MTKIVYNDCFGGFSLSDAGVQRYAELKGLTLYPERELGLPTWWTVPPEAREGCYLEGSDFFSSATLEERQASNAFYTANTVDSRRLPRTDPTLVQVMEELGTAADGRFAKLCIRDVPAGTRYRIDEYDGSEAVMTVDDYEWSVA